MVYLIDKGFGYVNYTGMIILQRQTYNQYQHYNRISKIITEFYWYEYFIDLLILAEKENGS